MATELPKEVPAVKSSKTIQKESLAPLTRAKTGGDDYDRQRSQYAKKPRPTDDLR